MKACRDCRHVHVPEQGGPLCHHLESFTELEDYFEGRMQTHAQPVMFMRRFGGCGPDAALFEAKDP